MLTQDILKALEGYMKDLKNDITFVVQTGEHEKRAELIDMLTQLASTSSKIEVLEQDRSADLRSPVSFLVQSNGQDTGIKFSGVPGGHEFNSLILAVLQSGGTGVAQAAE